MLILGGPHVSITLLRNVLAEQAEVTALLKVSRGLFSIIKDDLG